VNRRAGLVGFLGLLVLFAGIGAVMFLGQLDPCMRGGSTGGSCPALADVNGLRYSVGVARGIVLTEADVSPYHPISRTNVPDQFSELVAYEITGVDPSTALAAPANHVLDEDDSSFRILWPQPGKSPFPALCRYLDAAEQSMLVECGGMEPT